MNSTRTFLIITKLFYINFNRLNFINLTDNTININNWDKRKNSPYDYSVVSKAVKIAFKFDIEGKITDDGSGGDTLSFILDLR